MTWVRYDDNVRNHPKVEPLDDATYRLWREAIEWCAQNLTDGVILSRQLALTSIRASPARARKLVAAGLWHQAGHRCDSDRCPASGVDGWVVHDYLDYQPTREQVREEQERARDRQRRWRAAKKANTVGNGVTDTVTHAVGNGVSNAYPAPPRPAPAPTGRAGTNVPAAPPAASGGSAPAGSGANHPPPSRSAAALAIAACQLCDDRGYAGGAVCDHDPTTPQRARRGAAAVRAALRHTA